MSVLVLDGKAASVEIEKGLRKRVEKLIEQYGRPPVLATILVGKDPASATYVRMKGNACGRVGMLSRKVFLPQNTTTRELIDEINKLNDDPDVHGILLQHPVPGQIDERACFDAINVEKDVDGVTTCSFGRMAMKERAFGSATPEGIMRLLAYYKVSVSGKRAVVVGRSPILGKPMAMMLLNANATVTVCHSRTENLSEIIGEADVVVGAVGRPEFIRAEWIKEGAVVIDAGYHPQKVGDIEISGVVGTCSAYTPVPGGVGPMTIATLISQTVEAAERELPRDRYQVQPEYFMSSH